MRRAAPWKRRLARGTGARSKNLKSLALAPVRRARLGTA